MASDLPEKLLGIDIDGSSDDRREPVDARESAELVRIVRFGVGEHALAVPVDDVRTVTDVPEDHTRVPRTPSAIDGLTDLRGDVTAIIDVTSHFPVAEDDADRDQLLVFDSPDDEQSAAAPIDVVYGVESVPEEDVLDAEAVAERGYDGNALEHPLVDALVERERRSGRRVDDLPSTSVALEGPDGTDRSDDTGTSTVAFDSGDASETAFEPADETVESGDQPADADRSTPRRIVVELIPLVDVEKLLLASGRPASRP
ncbi:chemotaxis protein CheW [Natrarchaeobius oligotrophus]|uniref:Chemotaxis protein CheW n=1 Tax=Natrarchaeobius chitinivorans TaxID=1679083 RepID=A0A3N6MXF2_NATCH|nr:chemotaxis protein CheW [Natrarchaeobius chitinivorans]RQG99686.1 chemotaxis protein CheW [Natrarchaeobius chitinivorans]